MRNKKRFLSSWYSYLHRAARRKHNILWNCRIPAVRTRYRAGLWIGGLYILFDSVPVFGWVHARIWLTGFERERKQQLQQREQMERWRETENDQGQGVLDILRLLGGILLLNCLLSYFVTNDSLLWGWRPWFVRPGVIMAKIRGPVILTDAELAFYDGTDPSKPIYLALNGTIYDVSAGRRTYGPGGSYNVFAGKDAARGFITGCFAEDSTPDMRGAEWTYVSRDIPGFDEPNVGAEMKTRREQELRNARKQVKATIDGWAELFRGNKNKNYFEVGKVKRPVDWLEKEPLKKLCAQAEKGRPKPKTKPKDAGEAYRGS